LSGLWQFTPLREGACKASLYLEFQMQNALASKLAGDLLESMANTLVDAFSRRADQLY
jgi:ribosome-associated toxin RatA of RatAB toxin-antitoxin module